MTDEAEKSQDEASDAEANGVEETQAQTPESDTGADEAAVDNGTAADESIAEEVAADAAPEPEAEEVEAEEVAEAEDEDDAEDEGEEEDYDTEIRPEDLADDDEVGNEYDTYKGEVRPIEEEMAGGEDENAADFDWYILKVQSNREKSICAALQRRVSVAGLDEYFKEIIVPTEDVAEFKNAKRRVVKRKLYPGYIVANMALNDETWFLVRETSGIGDFTGAAGKPTPMMPEEVDRIVKSVRPEDEGEEQIKTAIPFNVLDRVRIKEGTFENFEGDVEKIDEANGRVTVTIKIFDRSTPVELEHWQIESV